MGKKYQEVDFNQKMSQQNNNSTNNQEQPANYNNQNNNGFPNNNYNSNMNNNIPNNDYNSNMNNNIPNNDYNPNMNNNIPNNDYNSNMNNNIPNNDYNSNMNNNIPNNDYNSNMNNDNQGNVQTSNQYYDNNSYYNDSENSGGFYSSEKKSLWETIKWPVIIIGGIIILIIIIILIVKGCSSKKVVQEDPTDKYNNESTILKDATNNYFEDNIDAEPKAIGECKNITLKDLVDGGYVTSESSEKLNTCDNDETSVKVCKLESGDLQYIINYSCTNSDLNINYDDEWLEGNENDINKNSDVKFEFLAQETKVSDAIAATEEEVWKDEITYPEGTYSIINSKNYYRYRDITYHWTEQINYYYPSNTSNVNSASAYYTSAPAGYTNQGTQGTVYKWYISSHQKYPTYESISPNSNYSVRGAEGPAKVVATMDVPATYTYRTIKTNQTIYRTRSLLKTETLTQTLYECKNDIGQWQVDLKDPCGTGASTSLKNTVGYKCYYDNSTIAKNDNSGVDEFGYQTATCKPKLYTYSEWNPWQVAQCTIPSAEPTLCEKGTGYIYTDRVWEWFTQSVKTYYPSGSTSANDENTYYADAPIANALKDATTKTNAFKWYKTETKDLGYSKKSPSNNAVRGEQTYSGWSEYTLTKPSQTSTRQIEEREKVSLTRSATEGGISVSDITDGYVTEKEMIDTLKEKGYNVNTLQDIMNLSNVTYKVKMYYKDIK